MHIKGLIFGIVFISFQNNHQPASLGNEFILHRNPGLTVVLDSECLNTEEQPKSELRRNRNSRKFRSLVQTILYIIFLVMYKMVQTSANFRQLGFQTVQISDSPIPKHCLGMELNPSVRKRNQFRIQTLTAFMVQVNGDWALVSQKSTMMLLLYFCQC